LLTAADLAALVLYLVGITAVGLRFYHRDTGLKEFLLGSRSMGWLPVALSILAADTSAITYLGQPAWVFAHDMKLNQMILGYLVAIPILILVFLPAYSRQQLYTAYQFLENRFGLSVRLLTSALFLFLRGSHAAIVIYVPALILADLMSARLGVTVLCVGLLTTFYTMLGGIKAVIWTDTIQVCTVLAGFTAIALTAIHGIPGSIGQAFGTAIEHGKLRLFDWSTNFNNIDNSWPSSWEAPSSSFKRWPPIKPSCKSI
jgi:Na+/proline symporter